MNALVVREETKRAEQKYPPTGESLVIDGVRLRFIDTGGPGPALVLLHGNGAMIADMEISGVVREAAKRYRVIAFDRPGYGYSERPRDRTWGPDQQARLFRDAFVQMGLARPVVFGHSWGTLVALRLALDHPDSVSGLVLASGYYFATPRADGFLAAPSTLPVFGDLMRHTLSPLAGRLMAPAIFRKLFAPQSVPSAFTAEFPTGLTLRPSQIKASTEETAMMVPAAAYLERRYADLRLPVSILAGSEDRIVDADSQSGRLHVVIEGSTLDVLPELGHMLHYFATKDAVQAIDAVVARADAALSAT